ncbi:hypothetical protein AN219_02145 [Streptomyces nanshensis]|nr:hypothetical protein AN219_02145 [Streptomyces nanshensis]
MWGHYWAASNGMTIASMVAPSRYKATASGFGYVFVKLAAFVTIFFFPVLFESLGVPLATVIVSVLSLTGYLAATYVLPEVYGYVEQEEQHEHSRNGREGRDGHGTTTGGGGAGMLSKSLAEEGS